MWGNLDHCSRMTHLLTMCKGLGFIPGTRKITNFNFLTYIHSFHNSPNLLPTNYMQKEISFFLSCSEVLAFKKISIPYQAYHLIVNTFSGSFYFYIPNLYTIHYFQNIQILLSLTCNPPSNF